MILTNQNNTHLNDAQTGMLDAAQSPYVSIVMASYNYGQYIAEAIQSVIDQTYSDWELIVVDDGSTDDTREIVAEFLQDGRIQYHSQPNCGQPQAKNRGISFATGRLIAFLDADDAWLPTKLAKQVKLFDSDPLLGVAYTDVQRIDVTSKPLPTGERSMIRGEVLQEAFRRTIPPFSSVMVRKDVLNEVGLFDESLPLAIDYDLWLRVAQKYRFDYVDSRLMLYRTGHANLSRRSEERLQIVVNHIIPKFLATPGIRERLGSRLIAEVNAHMHLCLAREARPTSLWRAIRYHLRAVALAPWKGSVWVSTCRCCLPDRLARLLKYVLHQNPLRQS